MRTRKVDFFPGIEFKEKFFVSESLSQFGQTPEDLKRIINAHKIAVYFEGDEILVSRSELHKALQPRLFRIKNGYLKEAFGIRHHKVYEFVKQRKIPCYIFSPGAVYFDKKQLDDSVAEFIQKGVISKVNDAPSSNQTLAQLVYDLRSRVEHLEKTLPFGHV